MTDERKRIAIRVLFEQLMRECFAPDADPEALLIRYQGKLARLKREWANRT